MTEQYSKVLLLPIKSNTFNLCKKLSMQIFGILENVDRKEICFFNSHNNLCRRDHVDINREVDGG